MVGMNKDNDIDKENILMSLIERRLVYHFHPRLRPSLPPSLVFRMRNRFEIVEFNIGVKLTLENEESSKTLCSNEFPSIQISPFDAESNSVLNENS